MTLIALLRAILSFASAFTGYLQQRKLIDLAQAAVLKENLEVALETLTKAQAARDAATTRFDATGGVPDESDPNLRD